MAEHKHILVVDDESQITRVLRTSLSSHGYDIRVANDGETALEIMKDWAPDLVITDLAMPNMDGLELCRRLRTKTQIPIIVLSVRGEERTKVKALDAGADDYVTKPFGMEELLARVRANLRRRRTDEGEQAPIEAGDFKIDPEARTVLVRDRPVHLTPKEFDLLVYLARHAGKVVTHRALLGAVWGGENTEQVEYLRVFVAQLRKKLEPSPNSPRYIVTDPWVGYRFEPGGLISGLVPEHGVIFSYRGGPAGRARAPVSPSVDHPVPARLYDFLTNSLLPFYGPSNLIELVQQTSSRWIRVTHFLLVLCSFAEGFLLWVLVALVRESRRSSPSHRRTADRTRRGPVSRARRTDPYEPWNDARRKYGQYDRKAHGVMALGALLLTLVK